MGHGSLFTLILGDVLFLRFFFYFPQILHRQITTHHWLARGEKA